MTRKIFFDWFSLKEKLDFRKFKPPFVSEGDIWWASVGINVGFEIDGKGDYFSRPVVILKKLSKYFFVVIPLTTKTHSGPWYFSFTQNNRLVYACLHQVRSIDYRRLSSKLGVLSAPEFTLLKSAFKEFYFH